MKLDFTPVKTKIWSELWHKSADLVQCDYIEDIQYMMNQSQHISKNQTNTIYITIENVLSDET